MPTYTGADGAHLHFDDTQPGSAEPVIVLAGGAALDPGYLGDLGGLSVRLIIPHLRGTGSSPLSGDASFWGQASDVEALRVRLGLQRVVLLGHSAGTRLALAYAVQYPDRVSALVLVTPPAWHLVDVPEDMPGLIAARAGDDVFAAALAHREAGPRSPEDFQDWTLRTAPVAYAAWGPAEQAHAAGMIANYPANRAYFSVDAPDDWATRLAAVTAPVLVVAGAHDCSTGAAQPVALADLFPHGEAVTIDKSGHFPWVEQPASFRAAVDPWLQRAVTASWYWDFGVRQARGESPTYERLSYAVAADPTVLDLLTSLPEPKRQPNLLYGVVRLLGGPVDEVAEFRDFVVTHWDKIAAEMRTRATQTNEAGRTALLLPLLAALPQPIALIEVGASAGLNLYPDRYAYQYNDEPVIGAGAPLLTCAATGLTPPTTRPDVVWRAGLDLNPLDVTDPADVAWLDALIWPEHADRRARLHAAVEVARADPPHLTRGDLLTDLPALVSQAPAGATVVVLHSAVLYQVPQPARDRFLALVRSLPVRWISIESTGTLPFDDLPAGPDNLAYNVLALDGHAVAWTHGHGRALTWFGPAPEVIAAAAAPPAGPPAAPAPRGR